MKKYFLLPLFVAAFALALGGCKKKEEGAEGDDTAAAKPAEGDKEEAKPDEGEKKEEAKEEEKKDEGGEAASTGIEECDAYVAAVTKYVECDKVPDQARDATKKGLEQMQAGWANMDKMPDDAKKQAGEGCKMAVDALKKGAEALGCEI
ncbi:MAG: hypothetical protein KJO07_22880 [Deltaproteobacteria bacterium]|jgi:hypothetical protein|nr:hypothetical protein [Deltaproteobacteria bacterium]